MIAEFISKHQLNERFIKTAQEWFIPLAEEIRAHHSGANRTFFVGINGCQGSGKSTLTDFVEHYLTQKYGLKVINLSLDDFYLPQTDRLALSVKVHDLFKTRGVPGTHDTTRIQQVLTTLSKPSETLVLPRFNKAIDNPRLPSECPEIHTPVDIVLFEGWCWGVQAQDQTALDTPINALEEREDTLGVWRNYVNRQISSAYEPLYQTMDYWIMLKAPSFEVVFQWRLEQEQKLAASALTDRSGVMSANQIERFIQHYQRLTEHALLSLPPRCHRVLELDQARNISKRDPIS